MQSANDAEMTECFARAMRGEALDPAQEARLFGLIQPYPRAGADEDPGRSGSPASVTWGKLAAPE